MSVSPLPLVDVFTNTYEKWECRAPTLVEMIANGSPDHIRIRRIAQIVDATSAAEYIARVRQDGGLDSHIQSALGNSPAYQAWQKTMPSRTPPALACYQKTYEKSDFPAVSNEIEQYGRLLSSGQCLFHAGLWPGGQSHTTTRPLSTTLCPQVALRNVEYKAKAYDAGRIDLILLRASGRRTRAFVFKGKGTNLGHEREVLLASGATLIKTQSTPIHASYPVVKYGYPDKEISIHLVEAEFA